MEIQLHLYMCVCVCVCVFACGCNACVTTKAIRVFLQAHAKPIATEKWLILLLQFWEMKKKKEWCDASSDKSAHQYSYDWMIHPRQKRSGRMFSMVWHSSSSCRIGRVSELFQWKQIWILCDLFKWIGVRVSVQTSEVTSWIQVQSSFLHEPRETFHGAVEKSYYR